MSSSNSSRRSFLQLALASGASAAAVRIGFASGETASAETVSAETEQGHGAVGEADIGFCTDMTVHHVQALEMCERVLGQDTGGAVQAAATEVLRNQSIEVGMMRAWLADWGASTAPPETVMAWMGSAMEMAGDGDDMGAMMMSHGVPLADMPGYASAAQLSALSLAEGHDKGRLWLELMRAHHVGGVSMAEAAAELVSQDKVVRLARTQAMVQAYEISQYDLLLETVYP